MIIAGTVELKIRKSECPFKFTVEFFENMQYYPQLYLYPLLIEHGM